jgi:hypothetical protein
VARADGYDAGDWRDPADWIRLDAALMAREFSPEELVRLACGLPILSPVHEMVESRPDYAALHRVRLSLWHWGACQDYAPLATAYRGLAKWEFGVPGCDSYVDHVEPRFGNRGPAAYAREAGGGPAWLDGPVALQVVRGGELALTVAVAFTGDRVLVTQVQVRGTRRGNRWLYRLPRPVREYAVDRVRAAWPDLPVGWAAGASVAANARSAYGGREAAEKFPAAAAARVRDFYDRPLAGYRRAGEVRACPPSGPGWAFHVLEPAP